MNKKKMVCDKQLADEIQKLLEKNDVDDTIVTEVVAKINGGEDVVDADGEKVAPEQVPAELEEDEEIEVEPKKAEDDDNEVDLDSEEEVEDEDDVEKIPEVDEEVTDEDEEVADIPEAEEDIDEEIEDEDTVEEPVEEEVDVEEEAEDEDIEAEEPEDEEDVEEVEDADEEATADDPFAKLRDPIFADGFNRGYAFAVGLMKMGKLGEIGQDEAEVEEEEKAKEKPSTINPAAIQKDKEERVLATDSMDKIKEQVAKEYSAKMNAKIEASQKVQPLIGKIKDIMAFDSAESIYKFALEQNGVNVKKYKPSAYEGMIDIMVEKHNNVDVPVVVNDAKPFEGFSENLSQAIARLKKINSK